MCFTYVCGTEGRGTQSHHRVCWSYHTSKHMAHSVRRRTLENTTEMKILVCIAVQVVVQLCATKHQLCMLPVCCQYESTTGARCSCSAYAPFLRCLIRSTCACSVKPALYLQIHPEINLTFMLFSQSKKKMCSIFLFVFYVFVCL